MSAAMPDPRHSAGAKISAIVLATVAAFLIVFVGQTIWSVLLAANFRSATTATPWSVAAMAVVLWLSWQYLGGSGWPRGTSAARRRYRRANAVSAYTFALSFLAGVLALIALAGCWIVFFQLVKTPANQLADASKYPLLTVVSVTIMSSLVSPIFEEIAFRGYAQQILESRFSATAAVIVSSALFMLAHVNHGLYWPKLTVYFLGGLTFGAIALLTNSILTTLPVHIVGDLTFFIFIWPRDAGRVLVSAGGADRWFWLHVAQAVVFGALALLAFSRLGKRQAAAALPVAA
jgi:membrane protease YdiL (CAAX protease family)